VQGFGDDTGCIQSVNQEARSRMDGISISVQVPDLFLGYSFLVFVDGTTPVAFCFLRVYVIGIFVYLFILVVPGVELGLILAKQTLYHLSCSASMTGTF
jgi:hypothetical protein